MTNTLIFILAGAFSTAIPLLLAAMGELVAEKSGVINLSIEGMMALGAAIAFMIAYQSGSHALGFLGGGLASVALSLIFSTLVLVLNANQVASGLAVGILGLGLSAFLARSFESLTIISLEKLDIPILTALPLIGPVAFHQDVVVYLGLGLAVALASFMSKTRGGLILRVVGEDPHIAHSLGFKVLRTRFLAISFGAAMAGLAGAYASTVLTPLWSDGMIIGRGWIALALVVFGTWRVFRILLGAYMFGLALLADLAVQSLGIRIPSQLLTSAPYVMTIIVLTVVSKDALRIKLNAPISLGENYKPSK